MAAFADTSFLLALILRDEHESRALRILRRLAGSIFTSPLALFEARNRLRNLHIEGTLTADDYALAGRRLSALLRGPVSLCPMPAFRLLLPEAERLLDHFSNGKPHRIMDTLHVATARLANCPALITFDRNQAALATMAGLLGER